MGAGCGARRRRGWHAAVPWATAAWALTLAAAGCRTTDSATDTAAVGDASPTASDLPVLDSAGLELPAIDAATPCPGGTGCACQIDLECASSVCAWDAELAGGRSCAALCAGGCPVGFACVEAGGAEGIKVCVRAVGKLCNPCAASADCKSLGIAGACLSRGNDGNWCGVPCAAGVCPAGTACLPATTVEGVTTQACQPVDAAGAPASCLCSAAAKSLQLSTPCANVATDAAGKLLGACKGTRSCGTTGLGPCIAAAWAAETCNGKDDDCDGATDDGNPCDDGDPCSADGDCNLGVCSGAGKKTCDDDNPCTADACETATGNCTFAPTDGKLCTDGNPCTAAEKCDGGLCAGGVPQPCPCKATAECTGSEDGNVCNGTLYCDPGSKLCTVNPATVVVCQDDGMPCTDLQCTPASGKCASVALADGTTCSDGLASTVGEACQSGACTGGTAVNFCATTADCGKYEDGDLCNGTLFCNKATGGCQLNPATVVVCPVGLDTACLKNQCLPALGVCGKVAAPEQTPCEDGNLCTTGDACQQGVCTTSAAATTCACQADGDCAKHEDGDACNGKLFCNLAKGQCELNPASVVVCPTGLDSVCAQHVCEPKSGTCKVVAAPATTACDADGSPCTPNDFCAAGQCVPDTKLLCACVGDKDCAAYDDGNPCNGTLYCDKAKGACKVNPATVTGACKDDGNACTTAQCTTGCVAAPLSATPCDDGNACTQGDGCAAGVCTAGLVAPCDDKSPCTKDSCNPVSGCVFGPVAGPCDDGNPCTGGDTCQLGTCKAGSALGCDDGKPCTDDACAPGNGCQHQSNTKPCSDGNPCTVGDQCADFLCNAGQAALPCDDNNPCTQDGCAPPAGCTATALSAGNCDDGNACSQNDACAAGKCGGMATVCDDKNACTADTCNANLGCQFKPVQPMACDDGSNCTTGDNCQSGICKGTGGPNCDDGNACTADTCDKAKGCANSDTSAKCNDANPCTTDGCDKAKGCTAVNLADGTGCDDKSACTATDKCAAGVCKGGSVACDDKNVCTDDSCDAAKGCVFSNNSKPCPDKDSCTINEMCSGGQCKTAPKVCDDGKPCTKDVCDSGFGCKYAQVNVTCNDDNPCTTADVCSLGVCKGVDLLPMRDDIGDNKLNTYLTGVRTLSTGDVVAAGVQVVGVNQVQFTRIDKGGVVSKVGTVTSTQWQRAWGVASGSAGVYAVSAETAGNIGGPWKTQFLRFDANDNVLTNVTVAAVSSKDDLARRVVQVPGKGWALAGSTHGAGAGGSDGWLIVVNDAGAKLWEKLDGAAADDWWTDIALWGNDLAVCGVKRPATNNTEAGQAGWVRRYTVAGALVSEFVHDSAKADQWTRLAGAKDGSLLLCGQTRNSAAGYWNAWVSRLNGSGAILWQRVVAPPAGWTSLTCAGVVALDDGGAFVVGTAGGGATENDEWFARLDGAGNLVAQGAIALNGNQGLSDVAAVADGFLAVGSRGLATLGANGVVRKFSTFGHYGSNCASNSGCMGKVASACDDGKPCTLDGCSGIGCTNVAAAGQLCLDGSVCTTNDACQGGTCKPGAPLACSDDNPCTTDSCDASNGCVFVANALGCDDGNPCTVAEACKGAVCSGGAPRLFGKAVDAFGSTSDTLHEAVALADGGVAVVASHASGQGDLAVVRARADGTVDWAKKSAVTGGALGSDLTVLKDGSLLAVGTHKVGTYFVPFAARFAANGSSVTSKEYPQGTKGHAIAGVAALADGGAVLAGRYEAAVGQGDALLIRLDASLTKQWSKVYGLPAGGGSEHFAKVAVRPDGSLVAVGNRQVPIVNNAQAWMMATDSAGNVQWERPSPIGTSASDWRALAVLPGGGFVAGGTLGSLALVARFDRDGVPLWYRTVSGGQAVESLRVTANNELVIAGQSTAGNPWICRGDLEGNQWAGTTLANVAGRVRGLAVLSDGVWAVQVADASSAQKNTLWRLDVALGSTCAAGSCAGLSYAKMDDTSPCTWGACTAGVLSQKPKAAGWACDDAAACTVGATCSAGGQCTGGSPTLWYANLAAAGVDAYLGVAWSGDAVYAVGEVATGNKNAVFRRFDAAGKNPVDWKPTVSAAEDTLNAVEALPLAGAIAVGATASKGAGGLDGWLVRLDAAGVGTEKTYGGVKDDRLHGLALLGNKAFAVGSTLSKGAGKTDGWLVQVSSGTLVAASDQAFGGAEDDEFRAAVPFAAGVAAVGHTTVSGKSQAWAVAWSTLGSVLWNKTIASTTTDTLYAVTALPDGGLLAVGATSGGKGGGDARILRLDASGGMVFSNTFGFADGSDTLHAVVGLGDGTFLAIGDKAVPNQGSDGWFVRLDGYGNVWNEYPWYTSGTDRGFGVALAPGGFLGAFRADDDLSLLRLDNSGYSECGKSGVCADKAVSDCDDGVACTVNGCANGVCSHSNLVAGAGCGTGKACAAGVCK